MQNCLLLNEDKLGNQKDTKCRDMSDIVGMEYVKRAIQVAAVGGFNLLLRGNPGSGKTMIAEVYASMLGRYAFISISETVKSLRKKFENKTDIRYNAVIVEDLPEHKRDVLLYLKELSIINNLTIIATIQPCPCGNLGSLNRQCVCKPAQITKYKSKGMPEFFDIHIEVPPVPYRELINGFQKQTQNGSTNEVMNRIKEAKALYNLNSSIGLDSDAASLFTTACQKLSLSVKSIVSTLRVAGAIACMDGSDIIRPRHMSEAIQYRVMSNE